MTTIRHLWRARCTTSPNCLSTMEMTLLLVFTGLVLAGCEMSRESTASADASGKELSEKSGVVSHMSLPASKIKIPDGTVISVRLLQSINSATARPGDEFEAELAAPVRVDDRIAFPKGVRCRGRVVDARHSGRLSSPGFLRLTLDAIQNPQGKWVQVESTFISAKGKSHKRRNTALIAGGAAVGTLIGGLAGGGKGAAIGASSGAGAGTAGAAVTGKKEVVFAAERRLNFAITRQLIIDQ